MPSALVAPASCSCAEEPLLHTLVQSLISGDLDTALVLTREPAFKAVHPKDLEEALFLCCERGHHRCVALLIECGANHSARLGDGTTPLHVTSTSGGVDTVRVLLKQGANAELVDSNGATPLSLAAHAGRAGIVSLLLRAGARDGDVAR